jgi:hypothetical protein
MLWTVGMFKDVDEQDEVKALIAERETGAVCDRKPSRTKAVLSEVSLCLLHVVRTDVNPDDVVPPPT